MESRVRRPPGERTRGCRTPRGALVLLAALVVAAVAAGAAGRQTEPDPGWVPSLAAAIAYGSLAALLILRRPGHRLAWVALAVGLTEALAAASGAWADWGLHRSPHLAGAGWAYWLSWWAWAPGYTLIPTVLFLLMPDGRAPSRRWRGLTAYLVGVSLVVGAGWAMLPYGQHDWGTAVAGLHNPIGVRWASVLLAVAFPALVLGVAATITAQLLRYRAARGAPRSQLKWLLYGGIATVAVLAVARIIGGAPAPWIVALAMALLPATAATAVVRHDLWDIDVVLSRSLLYAALVAVMLAAYVAVVALAGLVAPDGVSRAVAVVVVALAAEPVHVTLRRRLNRLFFGDRDDPYTAMRRLTERLEVAAASDSTLAQVAETVGRALRLPFVAVATDWTTVSFGTAPYTTVAFGLVHQGEKLGHLTVASRDPNEPLGTVDRRVLTDLARHVALVVRTVGLHRDLVRSRERIVVAREEERRRLRRDLHDGLGPQLASVGLQIEAARDLLGPDATDVDSILERVTTRVTEAVTDVRRLVDDLRPPALDDLGLVGALAEQVERFRSPGLHVALDVEGHLDQLPAAVDLAVYRIVCEALTNVARHASARRCHVRLEGNASVHVTVSDDGTGLQPGWRAGIGFESMSERAAELGGRCRVASQLMVGTEVVAEIPLNGTAP